MAVYIDEEKGTWRVIYRYTDWAGKVKQTQKRGFKTRREAQQWERETMLKKESKLDMTFASFCDLYEADRKPRLKASTWEMKDNIIRTKLLPYFGQRKIAEIDAKDVISWQNQLMAYRDKDGKYDATAEQDSVIISRVAELAEKHGVTMTEISLAWLLTKVASPVVGATKLHHIEGAAKAVDLTLPPEEIRYLEEPYVPHPLAGVMAQNRPAAAKEKHVWPTGDQKIGK